MIVCKFGGTSLASAGQIRKVCSIVAADRGRKWVVVSAPGKRTHTDTKVTDLLIRCGERLLSGKDATEEIRAIESRFEEITAGLKLPSGVLEDISLELRALTASIRGESSRFMDLMKAAGENFCAKVVAAYLSHMGLAASYINPGEAGLLLTGECGNARVLPEAYERLRSLKDAEGVVVIPGFFGYTPEGEIVTFPRGGSDITGSIIAAAVEAELYENFTDVDSVYAVNPSLIKRPRMIKEMTYREMRELSYSGFSVFHEEALLPAFRAGIPVHIRNTNNPGAPGTMIVEHRQCDGNAVVGIASDNGFCSINLTKYMMNREIGFGRKLLQILEDEGLPYEHTPTGIDNMSILLRESLLTGTMMKRILSRIGAELQVDSVEFVHRLSLIMVVGEGLSRTPGIATRATGALAKAGVNIEMLNQGCSEVSFMIGVNECDAEKAVVSLYHEFFYEDALRLSLTS